VFIAAKLFSKSNDDGTTNDDGLLMLRHETPQSRQVELSHPLLRKKSFLLGYLTRLANLFDYRNNQLSPSEELHC
jgi:hypothetical protein